MPKETETTNDWIENNGQMPVTEDVEIEVKFFNDRVEECQAGDFSWGLNGTSQYRIKEWRRYVEA